MKMGHAHRKLATPKETAGAGTRLHWRPDYLCMFEELFGLKKRPFGSQATSTDVFIGPQTAGLISRAKKVYAEPDAVVSVFGPVGSGKTTIVHRALSALGRQHTVIVIGRISLGPDEVLEFMLRELGLKQMPAGTIQKFTVFRAILKKLAENNIRLFVIVEDAERLGAVALAELEALTAADSGVSEGANVILMSEQSLKVAFKAPGLARLRQRTRLHYEMKPLSAPEVRGYLTNGLRAAGGDISKIIDDDAIIAIHALADGIPRVINGLASSALDAVADRGAQRLDIDIVKTVAAEEYGLELDDLDARIARAGPPAASTEPVAAKPAPKTGPKALVPEPPAAAPEMPAAAAQPGIDDTQPTKILTGKPAAEPELIDDTMPEVAALSSGEYPIPELIQDTLPDLEVLSPELARSALGEAPPDDVNAPSKAEAEPRAPAAMKPAPAEPDVPEVIRDTPARPSPVLSEPDVGTPETDPAALPADDEIPVLFDSNPGMQAPKRAKPDNPPSAKPESPAAATKPAEKAPARPAEAKAKPKAKPKPEPKPEPKPKATAAAARSKPAAGKDVPAWDRDPTMAELRPDLEALEHAMAIAQGIASEDDVPKPDQDEASQVEEVPEITLDDSIRRKIDIAEEALKSTQSLEPIDTDGDMAQSETLSTALGEDSSKIPTRADEELERIAAELAKAKTLEDVDDKMAETLFGEEFTMIAAEIAANGPMLDEELPEQTPTDEELSLAATGTKLTAPAGNSNENSGGETSFEKESSYGQDAPDALDVSIETPQGGMDLSASQRLATVRALNAGSTPRGSQAASGGPKLPEPEPIEDQINTSITQTLKALSAKQVEEIKGIEEDEEQKSGFFSRFRKS